MLSPPCEAQKGVKRGLPFNPTPCHKNVAKVSQSFDSFGKREDKCRDQRQRQDAAAHHKVTDFVTPSPPPVLLHTLINLLGEFLDLLDMLSADRTSHMTFDACRRCACESDAQ
jgi:hypothetical protein